GRTGRRTPGRGPPPSLRCRAPSRSAPSPEAAPRRCRQLTTHAATAALTPTSNAVTTPTCQGEGPTSASRFAPKGPPASAASPAHSAPVPTPHAKPHSGAASLTGTGASRRVRQPPTAPARNGAASAARDSTGAGPLSGSAASIGSSGSGPSATPVGATTVSAPKAKPVPTA